MAASPDREAESLEALLNHVVLQNIFKYLGYKDLKSCRAVKNTNWLKSSKKAWWSKTKVTLTEGNIWKYLKQTELHSCVKNYKIQYFKTGDFNIFFDLLGNSIKCLEFGSCRIYIVDEFRKILYTKFPNLEKLVVERVYDCSGSPDVVEPMEWQEPQFGVHENLKFLKLPEQPCGSPMPFSCMEILTHFPNLEALEAQCTVDVFKVISIIRQHDPKMLKLTHIDIHRLPEGEDNDSLRLVLLDPKLSLETLRLRVRADQRETLMDILDLHAASLKELSLFSLSSSESIQIRPRQPLLNLDKLSLSDRLSFEEILRCTPNVRKIFFNFRDPLNSSKLNLRISTCKELGISGYKEWKDSEIACLLNVFPNVEIVEISGLNNQQFSMICEHWTKLVSFTIPDYSQVDVFGLLGFNPDCKPETTRNPNITNLKDLQIFSVSSNPAQMNESMPGVELRNGDVVLTELEKLKRLQTFQITFFQMQVIFVDNIKYLLYHKLGCGRLKNCAGCKSLPNIRLKSEPKRKCYHK